MIDKKHIESILRVNGLPPTAPEEQIRSVLISSRYTDDEINTAITVLRENPVTNKSHIDGLHKVFRTDKTLKPSEISSLLGIAVSLPAREQVLESRRVGVWYHVVMWTLSFLVALGGIMVYMYVTDTGLFHQTSAFKFTVNAVTNP